MIPKQSAKAFPHMLMPGETIVALIKNINLYDVTKEEMKQLLKLYTELNGADVMKPGMRVMVPILERHHEAVFKKSKD